MLYSVGDQYPHPEQLSTLGARIQFDDQGMFSILLCLPNITEEERVNFSQGAVDFHLYTHNDVPFLLLDFKDNFQFDCSINILKLPLDAQNKFIEQDGNAIMMFMVDSNTGVLMTMRFFGMSHELVSDIRFICDQQRQRYKTPGDVDLCINDAISRLTIPDMISRSTLSFSFPK